MIAPTPHAMYSMGNHIAHHPIIKMFNAIVGDINVPIMIDVVSYLAAFTILISVTKERERERKKGESRFYLKLNECILICLLFGHSSSSSSFL